MTGNEEHNSSRSCRYHDGVERMINIMEKNISAVWPAIDSKTPSSWFKWLMGIVIVMLIAVCSFQVQVLDKISDVRVGVANDIGEIKAKIEILKDSKEEDK